MGDFFKPWRRRMGLLTLVMACLLGAEWGRSVTTFDQLRWSTEHSLHTCVSTGGHLLWNSHFMERPLTPEFRRVSFWLHGDAKNQPIDYLENTNIVWELRFGTFIIGKSTMRIYGITTRYVVAIPYWLIVLPLTLLSAYLLLSKPRPAKKAETSPATAI